ncbi:hypothetical protein ACFLXZ_02215, partial [Chloroflexota bacterium]
YDMVFNYPKVIDRLVREKNIDDKQLIKSLEQLVLESLRHFDEVNMWIGRLGGETMWDLKIVSSSADAEELLLLQLEKENWAISWYSAAKKIAEQNKVKAGSVISRVMEGENLLPEDFVNADEFINMLERHIADERRHVEVAGNAERKLSGLKNK